MRRVFPPPGIVCPPQGVGLVETGVFHGEEAPKKKKDK